MPGVLEMDAKPIAFCVLVIAVLGCGACSSPTASSKSANQNLRVVVGPNSVGSDATGLQWGVSWSVFLDAGSPLDDAPPSGGMFIRGLATPVAVADVSSTIAAPDGHVLATFVTSAPQIAVQNSGNTQVTVDRGIVVNQGGLYDLTAPSPTSHAMIAVRLIDADNHTHEVQIANEIRQDHSLPPPCTRGQPSGNTVRIGSSGFEPIGFDPILGSCLTFVNQDTVAHDIRSDPHPAHSSCPSLNVGVVPPGAARQSMALNTWGTCGYHDELALDDPRFKGQLVIQPARYQ
jgi:hypothetical protein